MIASLQRKSSRDSDDQPTDPIRKPFLPVLIIPGFMSSGLEIQKSSITKNWEGRRLWLNLTSLGFQSINFGGDRVIGQSSSAVGNGAGNEEEKSGEGDEQHRQYKSLWLQHMILSDDMQSENPGITVRNIQGLSGVDYLTPGSLTSLVSYVFGPVILALVKAGYEREKNLDAVPYDWRVPPTVLEQRDQYFTNTMKRVEKMYTDNGLPVVIMCHSLGCKTGHYFLNFARVKGGQEWLDKYIHTYMPVGGPHLGAPKAIRSVISGDKMGLEAFLTDDEALVFGRSLGSGPWLFPSNLPEQTGVAGSFARQQGCLTVQVTGNIGVSQFFQDREAGSRPKKAKVMVVFGKTTLGSGFVDITNDGVCFDQESFVFATQADKPLDKDFSDRLQVILCEPGVGAAKRKEEAVTSGDAGGGPCNCCLCFIKFITCWCIWKQLLRLAYFLLKGVGEVTLLAADALAKEFGGSSAVATSEKIQFFSTPVSSKKSETLQVELHHRDQRDWWSSSGKKTTCTVNVTWEPWSSKLSSNVKCSPISEKAAKTPVLRFQNKKADNRFTAGYQESSGLDMILREDLGAIPSLVGSVYDKDPIGPRTLSSTDAPPVKRVKAIYGVNLPTEVGAVYKMRTGFVVNKDKVKSMYIVDTSARLAGEAAENKGYVCDGGILKETKDVAYGSKNICGDGTVPYWSLIHVKEWEKECEVTTDEIDGAEHREILNDARFHEVVLDYITRKEGQEENV